MHSLTLPPFIPHRLLRGGHRQTIAAAYLPARGGYRAVRYEVTLDDGDQLVLHDDCPQQWQAGQRVVVMIHGLGGSHLSPYLVRLAAKFAARGVRAFRMDMRGCGAGIALARRIAHAGRSGDLAAALEFVAQQCPQSPLTAIGFSLGANVLLKLLGEVGAEGPANLDSVGRLGSSHRRAPGNHVAGGSLRSTPGTLTIKLKHYHRPAGLDSAIAVAPPTDLAHCARNLRRGANRMYDRAFLAGLMRHVALRRRLAPDAFDGQVNLRPAPRSLYEFDDRFVAPLGGFSGADEYYERSSSSPLLGRIDIPTLIVSAADDPLIPPDTFARAALSPAVNLQITASGGHCGFIGAAVGDADRYWLDWRIVELIGSLDAAIGRSPLETLVVGRSPDRPSEML